jgi:hypothetical protein
MDQMEKFGRYNIFLIVSSYIIQVKVLRSGPLTITEEKEFVVRNIQPEPEVNRNIRIEVGVPEQLHIEFEYSKSKFVVGFLCLSF